MLELKLLGSPQILLAGQPVNGLAATKNQALLFYLAVTGRPQSRLALAGLLWPDKREVDALANVRQSLYHLRNVLADYLIINRATVAFNPALPCQIDVLLFERECDAANPLLLRQAAVDRYAGDFLAGFYVENADPFDEWAVVMRERLHRLATTTLQDLVIHFVTQQETQAGLRYANQWLALEPWQEEAHRAKIQLLAWEGQTQAALTHYERCRHLLAEELGAEPSAETVALVEQIRRGKIEGKTRRPDDKKTEAPALSIQNLESKIQNQQDWGEMPDVRALWGRDGEVQQIEQWLVTEQQRIVTILGMGGMGKTTLAATMATRLAPQFAWVLWRSLLNAPPLSDILRDWVQTLAGYTLTTWPTLLDAQLALLFEQLRQQRCLLVLDNVESILSAPSEQPNGAYQPGYADYGQFFARLGESAHRSSLLLTSRELPPEVVRLERHRAPVRRLPLPGLPLAAGQHLLADAGLIGSVEQQRELLIRYSGNPLALQLVGKTIQDFFAGEIAAFLSDETLLFDDVREMLDQQFARLTGLERELLLWLAIEREPVTLPMLQDALLYAGAKSAILDALLNLQQRSLLEKLPTGFTLQNVIMEYATAYLVDGVCHEIETATPHLLHSHALLRAQAKEYVRQSQARLLLHPIGERLQKKLGRDGVMAKLKTLLTVVRQSVAGRTGYAGGNILNLLAYYQEKGQADLHQIDFSNLAVWQAYLPGAELVGVNFAGSDLTNSIFAEQFGVIVALAFSPDGQILAAGAANDNKIRFWQVKNGQPLGVLVGHSGAVAELAFSPDGKRLASSSYDYTICLWDLQSLGLAAFDRQQPLHILRDHEAGVWCVAFSPDGKLLASGSKDQTVRIWDTTTGQLRHTLRGHTAPINTLAFRPDGQVIASSGQDCTVRLWHVATGQRLAQLNGHTKRIWRLAFSPDGEQLASGDWDHHIRVWALVDLPAPGAPDPFVTDQALVLAGHDDYITHLRFRPDGRFLLSCSDDRTLRRWDLAQRGAEVARYALQEHPGRNWFTDLTADDAILAGAGGDLCIRLWDARDGQLLRRLQGHAQDVLSVAFDATGTLLAASCQDRKVRIWDMATQTLRSVLRSHTDGVEDVAFCAPRPGQSALVVSSSVDQTIRLWDAQRGQLVQILRGHTSWVRSIAVSPDGSLVASASNDETVRLWSTATGELLQSWSSPASGSWCWAVAFSPNGKTLAVGCRHDLIYLWAIDSPNPPLNPVTLRGHGSSITTLAFSPDGALLASGSFDQTIRLWQVATGATVATLQGHQSRIWRVAFAPDGLTLASASEDQTLCLWDVASGQLRQRLSGHGGGVRGVTFSPDGKTVVSSSSDGTIKCWDSQTGICLATLAAPRSYEGMNISDVTGISEAQKLALKTLGAVETADEIRPAENRPPAPTTAAPTTLVPSALPVPVTLPAEVTDFVGRETELTLVQQRLADPTCRLLTITGMGGVGKSRLALRIAHLLADRLTTTQAPQFPDGIYYVPLAALEPHPQLEHLLATTVAATLGISLAGATTPTTQLLQALAEKDLLLILDNCEHLPVAAFINQLLQQAQAIKLLVTSRARLNVRGEQLIRLAGLTTPTATLPIQVTNDDLWRLNDHSAVRLFVQSVQAILPDFTLDTTTAAPVVQICQLLHGLPLGIELAATWAQILPLPEIVQEIRQNLDFLESTQLDAPAHQRSLRAVFNHSWQRLTPAEQQALRRLTVFTGGFTREAAAQVAGATLPLLAQLTDKSLMQRIDPGGEPLTNGAAGARVRYELQPVVRQYAAEALAQAGETATYQARHAAAMAQFLATQRTELEAAKQQEALRAIHAEIENVRAAWQWLLAHLQTAQSGLAQIAEQVSQGLDSLFHFYDMRSWFQEGETIFGQLAQGLSTVIPPLSTPVAAHDWAVALWRLQAKAQARQGWFAFHLGRYDESRRLLTTSLHRLQQIAAEADTIFTLNYLGAVLRHLGEFVPASRYLQAAQRLAEQHNDPRGASIALNVLGQIALVQGDLTEARRLCQQALAIKRAIGDRWGMIFSLGYLGRAAQAAGEYGAAQTLFAECLTIARALDDQRGAAFALQCLGDTAYAAGALAEAQAHYQESLAIYQAIGNRAESSVTLALLGKTYRASGEATQARQALREALALAWSLPSTPGLLAALLGLANLALDAGQEAAALPPLQFVAQHPASSQQQRQQATQLLATLGAAVTVDSDWDLSTYVQTILSDVQTLTPIAPAAQPVAASLHATATATASAMGLIARSQELARLDAALTQMLAGRGQVYFVTGEAGSGKTALTHAFVQRAQATQPALVVADSLCSAQTGVSDPYLPFRQLLHQLTALTDESGVPTGQPPAAGAGDRADHAFLPLVVRSLVEFGPDLIENFVAGGALLARLQRFNGHVGDWGERLRTQIAQLQARGSAPLAQNRIFDQYTAVLQAVAAHRPLLLILDDLHWADASSLSFLFHLARNLAQSRVMLLGAYRPEDLVEDETGKPHPLQSVLGELKRTFGDVTIDLEQAMSRTGRSLVDGLLDSEPNQLGDDFRRALLAHTEGHPLFTVELLRDLKERGALQRDTADQWVAAPTLDWRTLPARVEGVIETRMGRLPRPLLELLQTASIEGEVFTAEVVARLLGSNEQQVVRLLGNDLARRHRLVSAADIITVGTQRLARYRFRHNLFQHYLYHSQTASERLYLHGEVAKALEALYLAGEPTAPAHATAPDAASVDAAALARHYQAAGMVEKALFYLRLAGNRAQQLSAHQEAITHLQQALTLLAPLPAARQRDEQELEMQIALGTVLVAVEGFGAATVEAVYQRALALCHHLGASPHLWPVLHGLWNVHEVRAELPQARTYGDELLRLTAANPEAELGLVAHRDMGATLHHLGEIADSRHYLERGLPFLAATQAQAVALRYSAGPGVGILVYLAADLWLLGYADQAVQRSQAALALAHAMKHPFSLALALNFAGGLHHFRRDPVQVQAVMTQMQMLLAEHAFPVWAAATQGFSGWVLVQQGALAQGIAQMEQGLVAWRAAGQQLSQTFYLGLIAEGYLAAGESEAGLARLDQALALVATLGERYWEAELYRLQGELWRLQPTAAAQAEACFEQAITVARRQEARTLELRATTSLCRLWQQQGKTQAAQERLAAIYGWFTEGFATVDLQETQQLLAALRV